MNEMRVSVDNCPVCRGEAWRADDEAGRMLGLVEPYRVMVCSGCGLARLLPQLGAEELDKLYDKGYFASADAAAGSDTAWAPPDCDYMSETVAERTAKFSQCLADLKRHFPAARSFLDVGAATGDMVNMARASGLAADGLEFSAFAVRQARERFGIELMQVPLAELAGVGRYDLIHLNHVFEHFNDPLAELAHLRRLLKPDGGLYLEVPCQFHFVEKARFRLRKPKMAFSLHSVHHPYFYSAATMRRLLQEHGFTVLSLKVFDPARYPARTPAQHAKKAMWRALSAFEVGNYVEVIARPSRGR